MGINYIMIHFYISAFTYSTYHRLKALTVLFALQWSSAYQGPCGRLCVSSVPGSDQARWHLPGNVWVGSPCCQPAVQEFQDPGPHHWHRIPSVPWFLYFVLLCPLTLNVLDCLLVQTHLSSLVTKTSCSFVSMQCKTQMRKPCRGRGKRGLLKRSYQSPHF